MKKPAGLNELDRRADRQGTGAAIVAILIAAAIGLALFGCAAPAPPMPTAADINALNSGPLADAIEAARMKP